jgi:SAM-dependent methyltransferase
MISGNETRSTPGEQVAGVDVSDPTGWSADDYRYVNENQVRSALAAIALAEADASEYGRTTHVSQLSIADIGCGTGEVARELAARGYSVFACDYSPSMVDETRRRCADYADRVVTERHDANRLALPESAYDVVHSSWVLHWVNEIDSLLAVATAAVKPGGHLVLQWNAGHPETEPEGQFAVLREIAARPRWHERLVKVPFVMRRHPADHLVDVITARGFEIVHRVDDFVHTPTPGAAPMTLVDVRERVKRTGMGRQIAALGEEIDDFLDEAIAVMVERGHTSLRDSRLVARAPGEAASALR